MVRIASFTDYHWILEKHRVAVEVCVNNGILSGYADGTFRPNDKVTLAELCSIMIHAIYGLNGYLVLPYSPESFKGNEIGHWAAPYMEKCRQIGIYHKDPEVTLPNDYATMDDTFDIVNSAYQFVKRDMHIPLFGDKLNYIDCSSPLYKVGDVTRSTLAYIVYMFCSDFAKSIHDNCVVETSNTYHFSAVDAEPFLRVYYSKDIVVALVQLISRHHCVSPDGFGVILKLLACKNSELETHSCTSPTIDHYTSLQTLKCLTEKKARLRLYNAAFLNDPSEGVFFRTALQNFLDCRPQQPQADQLVELIDHTSKSTPFYPNSAYIVSFSNLNGEDDHNSLPMWFQYADHCKGCAIKFHTYQFRGNVYNVAYGVDGLDSFFKGFFEIFNSIWDSNPAKYTEDAIISIAADILNLVSYLYKNESYEHEQESRIILFSPPQNAKKEDAPRDGELLPRTYLEVPFSIDSVTFGPDVKYPERLAVAFASAGLTCPFRKSSIPFISK